MKVIRIYDYNRRDCTIDIKCEFCGNKEIGLTAYDDRNFWDNVISNFVCKACNKKGDGKQKIFPRYQDDVIV